MRSPMGYRFLHYTPPSLNRQPNEPFSKSNGSNNDNNLKNKNKNENENENKNKNNNDPNHKSNPNKNFSQYKDMGEYLRSKEFQRTVYLTLGLTLLLAFWPNDNNSNNNNNNNNPNTHRILTFQDFKSNYVSKGRVKQINVINGYLVVAQLNDGSQVLFNIGSVEILEKQLSSLQDDLNISPLERIPIFYENKKPVWTYIIPFVPTILLLGGLIFITKKITNNALGNGSSKNNNWSNIFNVTKSKAKLFNQQENIKIKFTDIAGCNEAKQEIMEFVDFLKDPAKFTKLGAKIPHGAILSGPPGTGKTLLAKATAGEANVPFLSVSGSEFVEMFVGVGASRVRDLFDQARKLSPSIIFIDEIDAIGKARGKGGPLGGANDEREATLNQLLVEIDGFKSTDQIIILAGTNRPDVLDPALLRPGRFDRHIQIDAPDMVGRKQIYLVHLKKLNLDPVLRSDIDNLSGKLATLTPGFTGADIANACNEAALIAARYNEPFILLKHFEDAIERVIAGLEKKTKIMSPEEKKTVAYHEAGHAVCGWYLKYADPLLKVSIVPRGKNALGYAQYLPPDQYLMSKEQFSHKMIMALGGRVSEELHFDNVTSGAHDDFMKVTQMAQAMVTKLGMSEKVGYVSYDQDDQIGIKIHKPFSTKMANIIDTEVKRIVDEAHEACSKLLKKNIDKVDKVAKELLSKEIITRNDMIRLLGPRPFPERNEAFKKYLDIKV